MLVVDAAVSGRNLERRWGRGGVNAEIQRAKGRRGSLGFSGNDEMVEEQGNGRDGRFGFWVEEILDDREREMKGDREGEEIFPGNWGDEDSGWGNAATQGGGRRAWPWG